MATRPGFDSSITNRLGADHQELFFAVKAEFDTSDIRVWSGLEDLVINSEKYTGAGTLLSISNIEENLQLMSSGLTIALSGMDETVLDLALTENYQNRPVTIFLGFVTGGSSDIKGYLTVFKGRMTGMTVSDTPDGANIILSAESRLIDLKRPRGYRYTHQAQDHLYSGDLGLQYITKIQNKEIIWGSASGDYNYSGVPATPGARMHR